MKECLREKKFTKKQIKYAIKHLKVNWKSIALYNAECWLNGFGVSKQLIIDWSKKDECTKKEIKYVLKHISADWNNEACLAACWFSVEVDGVVTDEMVYNYLYKTRKFTKAQAEYGKNHWHEYPFQGD
ncbi:MAG: hypothetical protein IJF94_05390 [Eubacterium sp.]|nr:hypothetical protein [Eubacterium sp.]